MNDREKIDAAVAITAITNACMVDAKASIDKLFGDGYAKEHPELIGAFINAAAMNVGSTVVARAIEHAIDRGADHLIKALNGIPEGSP